VLCPRNCGVDRITGTKGYCGETAELRLAAAGIHRGEEPPITGTGGSGTIFVTGCNLGCGFCQNYQIAQDGMGRVVTTEEFARICLVLQEKGVENINIVTGSHAVPAIVAGIRMAQSLGLAIPILWNSSAYEHEAALVLLEEVIDVYLPDLKTLDPVIGNRFFKAPDYPECAQASILRMMKNRGLRYTKRTGRGVKDATLVSGVVIRHLVLPDHLDSTRAVLHWFAENAQGRGLLSVMMQYTPVSGGNGTNGQGPGSLDRYVHEKEYETVLRWLEEFDIEDGYYQELVPDNDWLPDFNRYNPFSSELATPLWHWKLC
jgi:putative pyruvate formate lyase activating enzyme